MSKDALQEVHIRCYLTGLVGSMWCPRLTLCIHNHQQVQLQLDQLLGQQLVLLECSPLVHLEALGRCQSPLPRMDQSPSRHLHCHSLAALKKLQLLKVQTKGGHQTWTSLNLWKMQQAPMELGQEGLHQVVPNQLPLLLQTSAQWRLLIIELRNAEVNGRTEGKQTWEELVLAPNPACHQCRIRGFRQNQSMRKLSISLLVGKNMDASGTLSGISIGAKKIRIGFLVPVPSGRTCQSGWMTGQSTWIHHQNRTNVLNQKGTYNSILVSILSVNTTIELNIDYRL